MFKFYGRRGSFSDRYFGNCPFVRVSFLRFMFELFLMLNTCVYTEKGLKKYQQKLNLNSYKNRREYEMINWVFSEQSKNENWSEKQENIFLQKEVSSLPSLSVGS